MNNDVPFHAGYAQASYLSEDTGLYDQQSQGASHHQQPTHQEDADTDIPLDESVPLHILQQLQLQSADDEVDNDEDVEDDQQVLLEQQVDEADEDDDDDEFGAGGAFANVGQGLSGRYKNMMMQYWQETINSIEHDEHDFKNHQLPLARIKKVMKTDEEVRMISAEAPILFAKGCDIFITELTMRAWIHAEENKRRTLQRSDIALLLQKSDMFDFLIDIVPREEEKPKRHHSTASATSNNNNTGNNSNINTANRNLDDGLNSLDGPINSSVPNISNGLNPLSNGDFIHP